MSDQYSRVKEELLQCIDDMFAIENIPGCPCEELRDKVKNNVFNLVVLGQFKRGKTSLISTRSLAWRSYPRRLCRLLLSQQSSHTAKR